MQSIPLPTSVSGYYIYEIHLNSLPQSSLTIDGKREVNAYPNALYVFASSLSRSDFSLYSFHCTNGYFLPRESQFFLSKREKRAHTHRYIHFNASIKNVWVSFVDNFKPTKCLCVCIQIWNVKKYTLPGMWQYKRMYTLHNTYYLPSEIHLTIKMNS